MDTNKPIKTNGPFNLLKRLKLLRPSYLGFVFDLFLEDKIPDLYKSTLINKCTEKELSVLNYVVSTPIKHNVLVVSDIPAFLEVELIKPENTYKRKVIRQYNGFLVDLSNLKEPNDYLAKQLSSRSRKHLRAKQRKLEESHAISYKFYFGEITKSDYDLLFDAFYIFLEKRFHEKKMYNKNLIKWKYYYELVYPLILEKRASLFVIYDEANPITITLNFHKEAVVFSAIEAYDLDYTNYNMGDISMLKHLEWCKNLGITTFDLSMGDTDFKLKWCNYTYGFDYHIFYNPKSLPSVISANLIEQKLKFKQYLRQKNIIGKLFQYDKFFYKKQLKKLKDYNWKETMITPSE